MLLVENVNIFLQKNRKMLLGRRLLISADTEPADKPHARAWGWPSSQGLCLRAQCTSRGCGAVSKAMGLWGEWCRRQQAACCWGVSGIRVQSH